MQEPVVDGHQRPDRKRAEYAIGKTTSSIDVINSKFKNRPLLHLSLRSSRIPCPTDRRAESAVELYEARCRTGRAALPRQERATHDDTEAKPSDQSRPRLHVAPMIARAPGASKELLIKCHLKVSLGPCS
jgi:hypothetical protein